MERTGIDNLISYWSASAYVRLSPSVFYERLEDEVLSEGIPEVQLTRTFWREGGWFSARREYLRVQREDLIFDICGFPIGNSFTFSWWLGTTEKNVRNLVFDIPVLGEFLEERLAPVTYYSLDAEASFQRAIHNAVLRVVDEITEKEGLRRFVGMEREPVMAEFYE